MSDRATVGVLGGSGVYSMPGVQNLREVAVDTPYGAPSDDFMLGTMEGVEVAFLPRHGRGHRFSPTEIPYRANLYAMRSLGVQRVLAVSAVGSLCEEYAPGDFVLIDQLIDRTQHRAQTFFGDGIVAHVPLGEPLCAEMRQAIRESASSMDVSMFDGGTYVCIEGPHFSTRAESELYRSWGAKIVGMTNGTEAKLCREAGMSMATIAMVTDFDCWHPDHDQVDVAQVVATAQSNARKVQGLLSKAIPAVAALGASPWRSVLKDAVMTAPNSISPEAALRTKALFESDSA